MAINLRVDMLEGNYLDNAVLFALGLNESYDGEISAATHGEAMFIALTGDPALSPFVRSFCREWAVGGPIIDCYGIDLAWKNEVWTASFASFQAKGASALVAAMRVLVRYSLETGRKLQSFEGLTRAEALQQIYRRPRGVA